MPIRPLLLGHRGARSEKSVPENTLDSFDLALARGCDGFEFDVRLSADHCPVICHDESVGGLEIAQTSAKQLSLATLRDVLRRYQTSAFLDIELKVSGLESITLKLLRAYPPARGCVVSSFLPQVLHDIHDVDASVPAGVICETRSQFSAWPTLPINYVIAHYKLLTRGAILEIKRAGKKVFVWTVNSPKGMARFAEWKVDGIISDHPERLVAVIGGQSKPGARK
jgi:glycerophosphoryl diester phosphodiesterase